MELSDTKKRGKISRNYSGFKVASGKVPKEAYESIRREIIKRLGISPASYNYKRIGESPLRESEVPVIQEIFSRYHIDAFTGEKIN